MTPVTADLLSAASLLAALIGLMFSLWSRDIEDAIRTPIPHHDAEIARRNVSGVMWGKAIPLLIASLVFTILLVPPSVGVSLDAIQRGGDYDAVKACFIAVEIVLIALIILSSVKVIALSRKLKALAGVAD